MCKFAESSILNLMSKKFVIISLYLVVIGIIAAIALQYFKHASPTENPVVSPTPEKNNATISGASQAVYCKQTDLVGIISFEGAAGSIYGAIGIKNISSHACQIIGDNFVMVAHEVQNISIDKKEYPGPALQTLSSGQTVYSKIRYPNGPQCNGPTKQSTITFAYKISPDETLIFKTTEGKTTQPFQTCTDASIKTTVQVWSITTSGS
jgi:hypothetical protein